MRFAGFAILCLAATASAGGGSPAIQSNPAFAGIGYQQMQGGPCVITGRTEDSPAADADIHIGDEIASIGGVPIVQCDDVIGAILSHKPGDVLAFDLVRGQFGGPSMRVHASVMLSTRSEVLARRVGKHLDVAPFDDIDGRAWSVDERHGRPLVIGAFATTCGDCSVLVERVAAELERRGITADTLAVTANLDGEPPTREHVAWLHHTAPLAIADPVTYRSLATTDIDRAFFTVIDCHGVVRLVAPIASDADDVAASIDEVLAGTEQAARRR